MYRLILFTSFVIVCYLFYRLIDETILDDTIDPENLPNVKWPFINLQDENKNNINMLCIRGPLEESKDQQFFKKCLQSGVKFVGCSSYLSFPQPCLNKHGNCHTSMKFEGKPYYDKKYVLGWLHPFRNPDKYIPKQVPEKYYGNKEYKLNILFKNRKKIRKTKNNLLQTLEKRSTQMLFRILEGNGKALYLIGVDDNGKNIGISEEDLLESIDNLKKMCKIIDSKIKSIRIYNGLNGLIGSVRITMSNENILSRQIF